MMDILAIVITFAILFVAMFIVLKLPEQKQE